MVKKFLQWIFLILIIAFIGYIVLNIVSCLRGPDTVDSSVPDRDKAAYSVRIVNTHNLLLTNNYELLSGCGCPGVDEDVYLLHGYWQINGDEFEYVNADLELDEAIFGSILIELRR